VIEGSCKWRFKKYRSLYSFDCTVYKAYLRRARTGQPPISTRVNSLPHRDMIDDDTGLVLVIRPTNTEVK